MLNNFKNVDGEEEALFRGQMVAEVLGYEEPHKAVERHCLYKNKLSYLDIGKSLGSCFSSLTSNDGVSKPIFNQLLDSGWEHNKLSYLDIAKKSENVYSPYPNKDGTSKPIFNQLLDSGWKHNKLSYLDIGKSLGSCFSYLTSKDGASKPYITFYYINLVTYNLTSGRDSLLYKTQFCGVPPNWVL